MNRRQLLALIGSLSAGTAVVNGTGAFTSVEAERDVSVEVASDANAYLALSATGPNAPYTTVEDGQLGIDLTADNTSDISGGQGVNAEAITVFEDLFEIRNQGTQEATVSATPLTFVDSESEDTLLLLVVPESDFPETTLSPGSAETYSLIVSAYSSDTTDTDRSIDDTITVTAEATS